MQVFLQRRWKGRWLMAVAVLHLMVGIAMAGQFLTQMAGDGWFNTVTGLEESLTVWFLSFAPILFLVGFFIDAYERDKKPIPVAVPIVLLALLAFMLSAEPVSGGWLLIPPALAMLALREAS